MAQFTDVDVNNLLALLDRVEVKGVEEAKILAVLSHKLEQLRNESGNDVSPVDESSPEEAG